MKLKYIVVVSCLALIVFLQFPSQDVASKSFHTQEQLQFFHSHKMTPLDSGAYFHLPQQCKGCHGFDTLGLANIDIDSIDINLYDDWETSMMGLSAADPLWKAKVQHEMLVNPSHANELQTLCTSCHAPLGHYTALYKGLPYYTMTDLANDSLGQSGVSCNSCHAIGDSSSLGHSFSGAIPFDTNRYIFGPFPGPMAGPMQLYVGLTPVYAPHISTSASCSPCHTLISNAVDTSGTPTGTTFVEQAIYQEYLNSDFPTVQQLQCQSCHMPEIEDPIKIANGYTALPGRSPFNKHSFAGANAFMVNLIKANKLSLGVGADDKNFDSTLVAIRQLLTKETVVLTANFDSTTTDTAYFKVNILNKAGHKFPSGYPSRRAVLSFIVLKSNGDTLFQSGTFDDNYEVKNISSPYELHHDVIKNDQQHQIYEMVMGDFNGNITTVLERGFNALKDNRLPPLGFLDNHASYDTIKIVGNALLDDDFNKSLGVQGTGRDIIHYHIPLNGYIGPIKVLTSLHYQSVPPNWLSEMRNYSGTAIDTFLTMYDNSDRTPIVVGQDSITNIVLSTPSTKKSKSNIIIYPNPTNTGDITIKSNDIMNLQSIKIYNTKGILLKEYVEFTNKEFKLNIPETSGVYYLIITNNNKKTIHKVLKN